MNNRGVYLYTAKVNVTPFEAEWIMKYTWYKLKGKPYNRLLGYLYDIVAELRKDDNLIYTSDSLIPLQYRKVCVAYAQVDPSDYHDLIRHKWFITSQGYAQYTNFIVGGVLMHRYLMNFPQNLVVDHICWNRLDNRKSMLKVCTQSENCKNASYRREAVSHKKVITIS